MRDLLTSLCVFAAVCVFGLALLLADVIDRCRGCGVRLEGDEL